MSGALRLTPREVEAALIARGVPRAVARATALREAGELAPGAPTVIEVPAIAWPLRILLPWSHLISDNEKYAPALRRGKPVLLLTPAYRAAKQLTHSAGVRAMNGAQPTAIPLALHARVWLPDNRPGHDVCNFAKCAHDGLEGVVYVKDEWLYDPRWTRMGVDVDTPRAELTLTPIP